MQSNRPVRRKHSNFSRTKQSFLVGVIIILLSLHLVETFTLLNNHLRHDSKTSVGWRCSLQPMKRTVACDGNIPPHHLLSHMQPINFHHNELHHWKREKRCISLSSGTSLKWRGRSLVTRPLSSSSSMSSNAEADNQDDDNNEDNTEYDDWEVGNVESDLNLLRMAIAESRANDTLKESERMTILDEIAKGRRELFPDLIRFAMVPVLLALFFSRALISSKSISIASSPFLSGATTPSGFFKSASRSLVRLMDIHYWTFTISTPLILLLFKQNLLPESYKKERATIPRIYERGSDWKDPRTTCGDHILCLLENWTSSVFGAAMLGISIVSLNIFHRLMYHKSILAGNYPFTIPARTMGGSNGLIVLALAFSQLVNRLGAAAALHQYPILLFNLQRSDQPRPLSRFTSLLQNVVKNLLTFLPIGFATDLARLVFVASPSGWRQQKAFIQSNHSSLYLLTCGVAIISSLVGPICHLAAFVRIIQIQFFTNQSLARDFEYNRNGIVAAVDYVSSAPADTAAASSDFKWRYRLKWRKPQRVSRIIRNWKYYLSTGYVPHKDRKETIFESPLQSKRRRKGRSNPLFDTTDNFLLGRRNNEMSMSRVKTPILAFAEKYQKENPNAPRVDRSMWVPKASADIASLHQEDYEKKDFKDPLGVAVQQVLKVGMSFDYDHDTRVPKGTKPSIHRLRARAAKSAIRRVQQIYQDVASQEERLNQIDDIELQNQEKIKLKQQSEEEIQYLAQSLLELIPTNAPPPDGTGQLDVLRTIRESDVMPSVPVPKYDGLVASQGPAESDVWEDAVRMEYGDEAVEDYQREKAEIEKRDQEYWSQQHQTSPPQGDDDYEKDLGDNVAGDQELDTNDEYSMEWIKRNNPSLGDDSDDMSTKTYMA